MFLKISILNYLTRFKYMNNQDYLCSFQTHFCSVQNFPKRIYVITQILQYFRKESKRNMYPYHKYLSSLELQNAVRRSRIQAQITAQRAVAEQQLRRSRIQAQAKSLKYEKQQALRRSRIQARIFQQQAVLRRAKIEEDIKLETETKEEFLRKAKNAAEQRILQLDVRSRQRRQKLQLQLEAQRKIVISQNLISIQNAEAQIETTNEQLVERRNKLYLQLEYEKNSFDELIRRRTQQLDLISKQIQQNEVLNQNNIGPFARIKFYEEAFRNNRILNEIQGLRNMQEEENRILKQNYILTKGIQMRQNCFQDPMSTKENMRQNLLRRERIQRQLNDAYLRKQCRY